MLATRHYMIDAYGCFSEQTNNFMLINDFLINVTHKLDMKPVMPPYILPFYYSEDAEDVGISAFVICDEGSHVTIHTFPQRSCYFIDILTNSFLAEDEVSDFIRNQLYASNLYIHTVDRREFECDTGTVDSMNDFGPHYMAAVNSPDVSFEGIYKWLDTIAPEINMQPISRPIVVYDKVKNPSYISGILVVAQSHIAFHYSIEDDVANIDIISCSFLGNGVVEKLLNDCFGDKIKLKLFARGSKHRYECQHYTRQSRIEKCQSWRKNIYNF